MKDWITTNLNQHLGVDVSDKPVEMWILAILIGTLSFFVLRLAIGLLTRKLDRISKRTATNIDNGIVEMLHKTKWWFYVVIATFMGMLMVDIPDRARTIIQSIVVISWLLQLGIWASTALNFSLDHYREVQMKRNPASATALNAIGIVGTLVLWLAVLLLALDNLGVNVTALIAGLGVGGIAVALAVQNILSDLFASLSILIDKPFVVGDFVQVDDFVGTVEKVGLKTTRVRSLSGEQLIFSNSDLLSSRMRNFGRMYQRRVAFSIGVTYDTPRERLKAIPGMIRDAIETQEKTRFDRSHFAAYGDFSINFDTVYFVLTADFAAYMDIQQNINLILHEKFEENGIDFAFPSQTLYIKSEDTQNVRLMNDFAAPQGT